MRNPLTIALALAILVLARPAAASISPDVPPLPQDGAYLLRGELPVALIYLRLPDAAPVDGKVKVWQLVVFRDPDERMKPARYVALQIEFDCQGRRTRAVTGAAYDIDSNLVESEIRNDDWQDAKPATNAEIDLNLVCMGQSPPGEPQAAPLTGRAAFVADFKSRLGL